MKECAAILGEHGLVDASTGGAVDDGASTVAQETFPLISQLVLEPTKDHATPFLDDVPAQLTKAVAGVKCDFLALPPPTPNGALGDGVVSTCLSAPKPHVLLL